ISWKSGWLGQLVSAGGGPRDWLRLLFFSPRWQQLDQDEENNEREHGQHNGREQTFPGGEAHFVRGVTKKALGEMLSADNDVPAHGKNADHGEAAGQHVNSFARNF